MAAVRASFFSTQFREHQNFGLLFLNPLALLWQTSRVAFAFSQAYIFHV
jgi:hypothetical protein